MGVSCRHVLDFADAAARGVSAVALVLDGTVSVDVSNGVCAAAFIKSALKNPPTKISKAVTSERRPIRSSVILAQGAAVEFQKLGKTSICVGVRR